MYYICRNLIKGIWNLKRIGQILRTVNYSEVIFFMKKILLPQFAGLSSEGARKAAEIPEGAEVLNITDEFAEGGPIVISYCIRGDIETAKKNKRNLDFVIDKALCVLSATAPA